MPTKTTKTKPSTSTTRAQSTTRRAATGRDKPVTQKRGVRTVAASSRAKTGIEKTRSSVRAKPVSAIKSVLPQISKETKVAKKAPPVLASDVSKKIKPGKAKKTKLVRDSFTMPNAEYAHIAALKKRCLKAGLAAKKSEVLRAAIANLVKLSDIALLAAIRRLEVIKTGRPAKARK